MQNCRLFSEKVLDFAVQIYYNKYIIISVEVSKCNTLRQLRQRICVRALRRADAASARHPASQHARQAAVSQISSARIKRKASNSERFRNAAAMAAFFADIRTTEDIVSKLFFIGLSGDIPLRRDPKLFHRTERRHDASCELKLFHRAERKICRAAMN